MITKRHVIDVRNLGLIGAIEMAPRSDGPGRRGYEVFVDCFERGLLIRVTGDTIALTPPLIVTEDQIGEIVEKTRRVIRAVAG